RAGIEPRLQRLNRLPKQLEAPLLEGVADARRPLHLLAALHQIEIVLLVAVDAVAAGVLRRRARAVRRRQQRGDVVRAGGDRHDADARAEPERAIVPDELELVDQLAQRLRRAQRLVHRAALEQHAELVSAEPREGVPPADLRLQQRADLPQQLVARAVAARVVDDLELVEIDVQDRVRRLPRFRALQRPLETALELAPIHELREDVVARRIRQPPVQLARLADVVKHEHAARDVAERIADRRGGALDVELVAVTANQECRPHRLRGAVAAHRDGDRVLDGLARLLVEAAEDLVDLPAHGIVELPAGQLLGDGVQVLHTALGVRRHDAIAYRLQRDLRALLLAEQRLFVELALRDVRLDADQPPQPAVLVDPALHAALHPAPLAVRMPHPMHALEELGLALEMLTDLRLHACHVVRMDEKAPLRDRLVLRVTEHRPPARREVHRVVADVVVPEAVVRRVRDEAIALLDRHEVLLETDPLEA